MKDIRFGIIGCGDVTEKKSGPAFKKARGSDLVAVMRRDEEKLIDYAKRHHIEKYSTDYRDLLNDDEIDAIYIATPPKWHHFYTLEAARYKKAIYVEKPMAMTVAECEEMISVCKEEGVPLYVAYYRRGQPKYKKVKELIEEGAIGNIRTFHYCYTDKLLQIDPDRSWLLTESEAGGGLLYDIGSHMMDMLLFFFGEVADVKGCSSNQSQVYEVPDVTSGYLVFKNGVQGSVQLTFNGWNKEDKLKIIGDRGTIECSIMGTDPVVVIKEDVIETFEFDPIEHVEQPYIQEVVDHMHGIGELDDTGLYGLETQRVLEALRKCCN